MLQALLIHYIELFVILILMHFCRCANRTNKCRAQVIEKAPDSFVAGIHSHNHPGQPGTSTVLHTIRDIKQEAASNIYKSSNCIVSKALEDVATNEPVPFMPKETSLQRVANRARAGGRPKDPTDLEFELQKDKLPSGK